MSKIRSARPLQAGRQAGRLQSGAWMDELGALPPPLPPPLPLFLPLCVQSVSSAKALAAQTPRRQPGLKQGRKQ